MEREKLLMTPGPTMIPSKVLQAMSRQIIHHRTEDFGKYFKSLSADLKKIFQTKNPVITLASSGTGGMESSIVNLFSPLDKVLVASTGVFGDRYAAIAEKFGLEVEKISVPWGTAVEVKDICSKLDENPEIKAVILTHNETSTGVTNDLEKIGMEIRKRKNILFIVDAVSSMGGVEFKTDEWGIDVAVAGSQKAFMVPPGLAFISISEKAMEAAEKSKLPKFYWDYREYVKKIRLEKPDTPFTPPVSLIIGASEAVKMMLDEGLDNIFARHKKLASAARAAVKAMEMELFAGIECASDLITSVKAPEGIDIDKVRAIMNKKYDIMVAGGQGHLKGKIFRIGHMGYVDEFDLLRTLTALEYSLGEVGFNIEYGKGVSEAQKIMR